LDTEYEHALSTSTGAMSSSIPVLLSLQLILYHIS
jgi:hypothetical protein